MLQKFHKKKSTASALKRDSNVVLKLKMTADNLHFYFKMESNEVLIKCQQIMYTLNTSRIVRFILSASCGDGKF